MKKLFVLAAFAMSLFVVPSYGASGTPGATVTKDYTASYSRKKKRSKKRSKKRRSYGILAKVNLSTQRVHVYDNGRHKYTWKISSGRKGYRTPTGTYRIGRMHKRYFSRKYNGAPMPYAMFFRGGYAMHGTNAIGRLGRPASHGCIRLHPSHAAKLFSMVKRRGVGRVRITY